jgi:ADP-heptose:LPS heptosyltransferase
VLKSVERGFKRAATAAIASMLPAQERGVRPDWRAREHRVLFLRHDRIGDMILTTGILRAIAASHPTVRLDVLASPVNAPVARHEAYLNDILVFDRHAPASYPGMFAELRRRRYDAVIDCMVTAPSLTTLLLMLATGAPHRVGVASRGNDFAYTLPVPPRESAEHLVDQLGALVTAFGLQPSAIDLRPQVKLTVEELERGERVWAGDTDHAPRRERLLVNVSAGKGPRQWPDDRFIAVIRAATSARAGVDVVVVSAPSERGRAARIAAESGSRLVEDRGIRDAMSIVSRADVIFSPDTSIAHAASAFGKPAVVLFHTHNARVWGPYETDGRAVESLTASVADIPADEAARALVRMLERASPAGG